MPQPRKHASSAARAAASEGRLREGGGRRLPVRLTARADESLDLVRQAAGDPSDTAAILRLIEEERARLEGKP